MGGVSLEKEKRHPDAINDKGNMSLAGRLGGGKGVGRIYLCR